MNAAEASTESMLAAAREAHSRMDWPLLESQVRRVLLTKPESAEAHYLLAECLLSQGSADEAVFHYEKALKDSSEAPARYLVGNGRALSAIGKPAEATAAFGMALEKAPDDPLLPLLLGLNELNAGRPEQAISAFREAIRRDSQRRSSRGLIGYLVRKTVGERLGFADAHYHLGRALEAAGKTPEAIDEFRRALAISGDGPLADKTRGILESLTKQE